MTGTLWTDRTIRGPASEYLTAEELRKLFGLPADWFDEQLKNGVLPGPIKLTAKTQMFTWEHAVFVSLWLKFNAAGLVSVANQAPEKSGK